MRQIFGSLLTTALIALWMAPSLANAQSAQIDVEHSTITVHVFKSGLFSFAGDNHEIHAPISGGAVDETAKTVDLRVETGKLTVLDPGLSADKRAQVQQEMMGPHVLDTGRFPEIRFHASQMNQEKPGEWRVAGDLTLHGQTHQITVHVSGGSGRYHGTASFKQTEFGITPVSVAGGTIKVKDELNFDFEIVLKK